MAVNALPAAGPPGWVVSAFTYAVGVPDRSRIRDAQVRTANQAGYTRAAGYTRQQQIAIGEGLRGADSFALGQGGGPGSDRAGPRGPPSTQPPPDWQGIYIPGVPVMPPGQWEDMEGPEEDPRGPMRPGIPVLPPGVWDDMVSPSTGFVQSPGYFPQTMPRVTPGVVIGSVLARVIGVLGSIFWPSTIGDDPWYPYGVPEPATKGPPSRNRRPRTQTPDADDWYNWGPDDFPPRVPGQVYPETRPGTRTAPDTRGNPWPTPGTRPGTRPRPIPGTRPGTRPGTLPRISWPDLLPYAIPFLMPRPGPSTRGVRLPDNPFGPDPLTPYEPRGVDSPQPFAQPYSYRTDNCPPCEQKRKRKRDTCTNPITSKRKFKRGSVKYQTITRKLKCPA